MRITRPPSFGTAASGATNSHSIRTACPLIVKRRLQTACAATLLCATATVAVRAADVSWDNGSSNMAWDTSSVNWTGAAWNNAAGDGAVFGAVGAGAINLPGAINVDSMNFT